MGRETDRESERKSQTGRDRVMERERQSDDVVLFSGQSGSPL